MDTSANARSASKGFTLVEMLIVITIIGILMAFLTGAVIVTRTTARNATVEAEIRTFENALQEYKVEFTELPPTFWSIDIVIERSGDLVLQTTCRNAVVRHLRKAFPRYVPGLVRYRGASPNPDARPDNTAYEKFANDIWYAYGRTIDPLKFDAASSLPFWLGGLPEQIPGGGQWIPAGFHTDPEMPFKPGLPRTGSRFPFDPDRIEVVEVHYSDPNNASSPPVPRFLRYYPDKVTVPYAYFKPHRIQGVWQYLVFDSTPRQHQYDYQHAIVGQELGNNCVPYRDPQSPPRWRNHDTCQIIAGGLDGHFGNLVPDNGAAPLYRFTKTFVGFTKPDYDNLANFCKGRLQDET